MSNKVNLYNIAGKKIGDVELPAVFSGEANSQLLSQYVRVFLANNRQGTRDTKDRSEVNGKARKPYKQKGTGHARHGSLKAPSMKGGGIAHGPKPYDFSLKMSKVMKQKALESAYASKAENCVVLDDSSVTDIKTKVISNFLDEANIDGSVLFITSDVQSNLLLASRNIPAVKVSSVANVNAYEVLNASVVVIEKPVLELIENKYGKKEEIK